MSNRLYDEMTQKVNVVVEPTSQRLAELPPPEMVEPIEENKAPDAIHFYPIVAELNQSRRAILIALVTNVLREDTHTETQIAADLGITRNAIYKARQDRKFSQALSLMMRDIIAGNSDIVTKNLFTLAEKSVKANEILLRIAEVFRPTQRNLNINASINTNSNAPTSPQQGIDRFVSSFIALGYDEARLLKETSERFRALKAEGLR